MSKAISNLIAKAPQMAQCTAEYAKPKLATFVKYAKVELAPPTPADIPRAIGGLRQGIGTLVSGRFMQIPLKQAWLNTLVATEVCLWFFAGECIVGYKIYEGWV